MRLFQQAGEILHHLPLAHFNPVLLDAVKGYNRHMLTRDVSAGLTVGMVALPLAMAFGIASGVPPEAGLYTAIIAGFLISLLGGCRVQIGGPAGAFVVIIYGIIAQYGISNLMLATIGSGVILFFMGLFKLGGFIKFIPISIVIGFTNGIAVMIGLQQVKDFFGLSIAKMPADFFSMIRTIIEHFSTFNPWAFGIALTSFLLIFFWPKGYSMNGPQWKRWLAHLPGTVVVLVLSTVFVSLFNIPVETVGSKFGGIPQGLPTFQLPDFDWQSAKQLYGAMLTLAVLGSIESLLCARVADTMTDDRHDPNQELMGQGIANFVVPFFGGIPATGTIARTVTNIKSGAFSPVAGMVHAVTLLVVILVAAPLAASIPLSALAAILVFVAWNMGNWREFVRLRRMSLSYKATLLITFFLTVIFDLTVAVEFGLVVACIFFLIRMNNITVVEPATLPFHMPDTVEAWHIRGALFFGSISKLEHVTDPHRLMAADSAKIVILDFSDLVNIDNSAMDQIEVFVRALHRHHHELIIAGAAGHPLRQLERTGIAQALGPNLVPDMEFAMARADLVLEELALEERRTAGAPVEEPAPAADVEKVETAGADAPAAQDAQAHGTPVLTQEKKPD
ncbi:SulP family inorganic anion transporter [uncultured Sutterella sp.]|uniref:SulP family inorganic anion transporter n=1 Tax=uncultured Sutterella sp. TaxID=286133 RepID=UPI0025EBD82F|nr:SulP family inorganic anion transporter [uncultured Sutterella sp.]